ncbi:hypothetical protein M1M34_gp048 [Haloarcula tailed virus 2]|uniref:Uncharacterized protein n=1 Tax=Haloarcula tailed virus 2 TaxID=2877989 RepID=A0AAE9BYS2_9CAUD|nr:hypothetical protein M1M34_gp048 [Haloarcula tailed virus 2]UBF23199.1 hypothetical protein HATV-2_gp48 [Haloarcula tailed virus 2]
MGQTTIDCDVVLVQNQEGVLDGLYLTTEDSELATKITGVQEISRLHRDLRTQVQEAMQ